MSSARVPAPTHSSSQVPTWTSTDGKRTTPSGGHGGSLHPVIQAGRTANICWQDRDDRRTIRNAADARRAAQNALRVAVREACAADWSWDRISAALARVSNDHAAWLSFSPGGKGFPEPLAPMT